MCKGPVRSVVTWEAVRSMPQPDLWTHGGHQERRLVRSSLWSAAAKVAPRSDGRIRTGPTEPKQSRSSRHVRSLNSVAVSL